MTSLRYGSKVPLRASVSPRADAISVQQSIPILVRREDINPVDLNAEKQRAL
jgi:hypothetical protein